MPAHRRAAKFFIGTIFYENRYSIFCENLNFLRKMQTVPSVTKKRHEISYSFIIHDFFKPDLALAKNKAATCAIEMVILTQA